MKNCTVKMLALAALGLAPSIGFAQTTTPQPDIVGLKLGMTMSDAEAALKKYNPDVKIVSLNFLASTSEDVSDFSPPRADKELQNGMVAPDSPPPKVKVPIELIGSIITHFYGGFPSTEISENSSEPVGQVSGEWLALDFTPTDDGGRLYAISHTVAYPIGGTFSPTALQAQLIGKYGQPSETKPVDGTTDVWMFDRRSRLLPTSHPDYERCVLVPSDQTAQTNGFGGGAGIPGLPGVDNGIGGIIVSDFSLSQSGSQVNIPVTVQQYNEAFSGGSGDGLSRLEYDSVEAALDNVEGFTPNFLNRTSDGLGNPVVPQARGCGIQIYAQFQSNSVDGEPAYLMISLSDQNAAFYDNGVAAYVRKKLSALAPAASAPAPNL